jgi:hypothetical protein
MSDIAIAKQRSEHQQKVEIESAKVERPIGILDLQREARGHRLNLPERSTEELGSTPDLVPPPALPRRPSTSLREPTSFCPRQRGGGDARGNELLPQANIQQVATLAGAFSKMP